MARNIFGTPEPSLSLELRKVLDKENILTTKTKKRVLDALDEHITNDEDRKIALNRRQIVQEIYSSEESYISRLAIVIEFFKKPIQEKRLAPTTVLNTLFGNVESIYKVNSEFLERLKANRENLVSVFLTTAPFFKVYSAYAYTYKNIINILESMPKSNPAMYQFICQQETRPEVGIKLSSLLISPVQRIPRYLLLLRELRALTPETTSAHCELDDAIKVITNIVEHIETLMKEQENMSRLLAIQRCLLNGKPNIIAPGRKLIKEGKLCKIVKDEISPRYILLLNDMILYCKDWSGSSLKCLRVLPIDKCTINAVGFKRGVFSLQCQSFSVVLCLKSNPEQAQEWVDVIQSAIVDFTKNKQSLRRMSSHRRPLQRKDFNQLDDGKISLRKRPCELENEKLSNEVCIVSPWKKMKSCTSLVDLSQKTSDTKGEENKKSESNTGANSNSTSYIKMAKQLITSVKQTTQKFIHDVDPSNCQTISSKMGAINN